MLKEIQRDRGLAVLLLLTAAVLLVLVVRDFGASLPEVPRVGRSPAFPAAKLPARQFEGLFAPGRIPVLAAGSNQSGAFFTGHFLPPPKPPPVKPTTRKVGLLYLGFLQAGTGPRKAVLQVDNTQLVTGLGSNITANLFVSEIALRTLMLTNTSAQTNILHFNVQTNLEVPLP